MSSNKMKKEIVTNDASNDLPFDLPLLHNAIAALSK